MYFERKQNVSNTGEASFQSRNVSDCSSSWGGLNEFPVERTSSGSQPTMLDEFEAEIR